MRVPDGLKAAARTRSAAPCSTTVKPFFERPGILIGGRSTTCISNQSHELLGGSRSRECTAQSWQRLLSVTDKESH